MILFFESGEKFDLIKWIVWTIYHNYSVFFSTSVGFNYLFQSHLSIKLKRLNKLELILNSYERVALTTI